jgi:predicted nuclease with TOPRIM domain
MTTDKGIHEHINELVAEEKSLREQLAGGEISQGEEHERLRAVEVELDQLWDLLRQRAAKRQYGEEPDEASERPADVVEKYLN